MNLKRWLWHILFWFLYFGISLFNELYLSESFVLHPSLRLLMQSSLSVFIILIIKAVCVYLVLYLLIPEWINSRNKFFPLVKGILVILLFTLLIRLAMHHIIWDYIYQQVPSLQPVRLLARYFYSLLELLQVVGITAAIKLYKLRVNALSNEKNLVQEKLKAEMMHLKAQINPHFLFNTLNSIFALARSQSPNTPDTIARLSKILRFMLYETERKTIAISEEIKIIEDYIALQQMRFGERIKMSFAKSVDNDQEAIAPLLLLPLVENAYKHCNAVQGEIELKINLRQRVLEVSCRNSVDSGHYSENKEGLGLKNLQRQLELLYRKFDLHYKTANEFFILHLQINLDSNGGNELFDHRR